MFSYRAFPNWGVNCLIAVLASFFATPTSWLTTSPIAFADRPPTATNETVRGRVVYLAEAMERRFGIKSVREAADRTLAIETKQGTLIPLVEDVRGRAFRADPRLMAMKEVEILVRRFEGAPAVQVVRLFSMDEEKRYEIDYWCEICAIAMFELKPCDCCQGDIELRRRPAPRKASSGSTAP